MILFLQGILEKMKTTAKIILRSFLFLFLTNSLFSQEALKSTEEEYYDFTSLLGLTARPTLSYRTLSDSSWQLEENAEHVWIDNNLGDTKEFSFNPNFTYKIYSPEWYNSYNSAEPYGQNDGALWQGKGYNTALTGGIRLEGYGVELTLKPQISFSQNLPFAYATPAYYGVEGYEGKAGTYGDYSLGSLDAPQRFGNKPIFNFDFGDSEIRYSWKTLTIGFGTQNIWLGPAQENPIMHSNNAAGYPHLDFGVRRQNISFKDIDFGDIEFRYWMGKTTESDYFDNDSSNNDNLITGLTIAYEIPFLKGLSVGFNRTMLSKWKNRNAYTFLTLLVPFMKSKYGYDESDQRASIFADYYIPKGGIDLYFEWGKNDYNSHLDNLMRYPFHTQAITAGFEKTVEHKKFPDLYSKLGCEIIFIETSMDYPFFYDWGMTGNDFYSHGIVLQGYTNKGQYIGAGIGAGGNAQQLSYKVYYPKGYTGIILSRVNPDLNYSYFLAKRDPESETPNEDVKKSIRVIANIGVSSLYYITKDFCISGSFIFSDDHNPLNTNKNIHRESDSYKSEHRYNFVTQINLKYYF